MTELSYMHSNGVPYSILAKKIIILRTNFYGYNKEEK